jgi:hypothetical protein
LTEFGITRNNNDEQFLKHSFPMEVRNFGSVRFFSWSQPLKHRSEREHIESGNSNASIERFKIVSSPFVILKFSDIEQNDSDDYFNQ